MKAVMNPQLFLSGFKNGPVHTWRTTIELAYPHVSDGVRIHSGDVRFTRCVDILVIVRRGWTRFFLRHQIQKYPDSRAPSVFFFSFGQLNFYTNLVG